MCVRCSLRYGSLGNLDCTVLLFLSMTAMTATAASTSAAMAIGRFGTSTAGVGFARDRYGYTNDGFELGNLRTGHVALVLEFDRIHFDHLRTGDVMLVNLFAFGSQSDRNHYHLYLDFGPFLGRFVTALGFGNLDRKFERGLERLDFGGGTTVVAFEFGLC